METMRMDMEVRQLQFFKCLTSQCINRQVHKLKEFTWKALASPVELPRPGWVEERGLGSGTGPGTSGTTSQDQLLGTHSSAPSHLRQSFGDPSMGTKLSLVAASNQYHFFFFSLVYFMCKLFAQCWLVSSLHSVDTQIEKAKLSTIPTLH